MYIIICFEGPCSLDEVFFPSPIDDKPRTGSLRVMGSCFKINLDGKARFEDVNDVCQDSYTTGSQRSSFSQRDPEYGLLMGSLDFLKTRTVSQRYKISFEIYHCIVK